MLKLVILAALATCAFALSSKNELGSKIHGGEIAPDGQFPYQVSLRGASGHICGGSILNQFWIVTAAHCVISTAPSSVFVMVGTNRLNGGGVAHPVDKIIYHENYDEADIYNDIAVIKLTDAIAFDNHAKAIALSTENIGAGINCVFSGWGTTESGTQPNDLQYINLHTLSVADCRVRNSPYPIYDSQVCTLTKKGEGACEGDSGSPLIANGALIGLLSWGRPCALGFPDVYTRITSFRTWIDTKISEN